MIAHGPLPLNAPIFSHPEQRKRYRHKPGKIGAIGWCHLMSQCFLLLVMWSLCSVCVVFIIWILLECFKCGNVQVTNCGTTHVTNLASLLTLSNSIATFCMRGVQSSNHLP
uniref:Uncharacterized protein n=1 Tax=Cacopsylla melanoneura TaxID=428564 RepID=A0A8D8X1N1_9HEMI